MTEASSPPSGEHSLPRVFQLVHGGHLDSWNFRNDPEDRVRAERLVHYLMKLMGSLGVALHMFEESEKKSDESLVSMPMDYAIGLSVLPAQSFVFALDGVAKALRELNELPSTPEGVAKAADNFSREFPAVVHLRDSLHHWEERVQGRARGRSLAAPEINTPELWASHGARVVGQVLVGNRLLVTLADGRPGEVEVSEDSALAAQGIIQQALNAYVWTGPWKVTEPRWPFGIRPHNDAIMRTTVGPEALLSNLDI